MGSVLQFPSRKVQGLAYLDEQLRTLLVSKGADQELVDFAADALQRTYRELSEAEQYTFQLELPPEVPVAAQARLAEQINEGLEGIRADNHAMLVKLVAQLVLAEVRLFAQQRRE